MEILLPGELAVMISPAPGIHRPSNNGASAIQTAPTSKAKLLIHQLSVFLDLCHPGLTTPQRVRTRCPHRSYARQIFVPYVKIGTMNSSLSSSAWPCSA